MANLSNGKSIPLSHLGITVEEGMNSYISKLTISTDEELFCELSDFTKSFLTPKFLCKKANKEWVSILNEENGVLTNYKGTCYPLIQNFAVGYDHIKIGDKVRSTNNPQAPSNELEVKKIANLSYTNTQAKIILDENNPSSMSFYINNYYLNDLSKVVNEIKNDYVHYKIGEPVLVQKPWGTGFRYILSNVETLASSLSPTAIQGWVKTENGMWHKLDHGIPYGPYSKALPIISTYLGLEAGDLVQIAVGGKFETIEAIVRHFPANGGGPFAIKALIKNQMYNVEDLIQVNLQQH
jgi:hypothetical protein